MAPRILVIRFGSLGDIVLTSATVLNLKLAYPDSHLVYLTKARFAPIVRLMAGVDELLTLPNEGALGLYQFLLELDKRNVDIVLDLHGNSRSWLSRHVVASGQSAVYPKRRLERWLLVHQRRKSAPDSWPHTIDLYNSPLASLGISAYCQRPILWPNLGQANPIRNQIAGDYVVVAPGAAHPTKQWPMERFVAVARAIHATHGLGIVWAATANDAGRSGLEKVLPKAAFIELVDYPVQELAGVIADARLTLANDSGLMHVASGVGTPVIAIFGPTHPALGFAPRGLFDRVVEVDEPCRPCSLHGRAPCYRTEQFCFTRVSPEMVVQEVATLLGRKFQPALLIDRDGTLIVEKHYLADPEGVELIPGAATALRLAAEKGYKLVLLSNQSGIARGYFDLTALDAVQRRIVQLLAAEGVALDDLEFCPHYPGGKVAAYAMACGCRKPAPGMAEKAALRLGLNLHRSVVVGDKLEDLHLGLVIGSASALVLTGHGKETEESLSGDLLYNRIAVYESLLEAVLPL